MLDLKNNLIPPRCGGGAMSCSNYRGGVNAAQVNNMSGGDAGGGKVQCPTAANSTLGDDQRACALTEQLVRADAISRAFQVGGKNKRKTNKRKTNKRKTNKRKTNKRKTNKRKTNKRKKAKRKKAKRKTTKR